MITTVTFVASAALRTLDVRKLITYIRIVRSKTIKEMIKVNPLKTSAMIKADRACYLAGWNASKRTRTYDLDAAEYRHDRKCDNPTCRFDAGWTDLASDKDQFASLEV